jgi:hypothetical protein
MVLQKEKGKEVLVNRSQKSWVVWSSVYNPMSELRIEKKMKKRNKEEKCERKENEGGGGSGSIV